MHHSKFGLSEVIASTQMHNRMPAISHHTVALNICTIQILRKCPETRSSVRKHQHMHVRIWEQKRTYLFGAEKALVLFLLYLPVLIIPNLVSLVKMNPKELGMNLNAARTKSNFHAIFKQISGSVAFGSDKGLKTKAKARAISMKARSFIQGKHQ